MRKKVVTVKPDDTVETALAKAQAAQIGVLIVVDKNKIVGILTTTDLSNAIINPLLGIGEPGSRIIVTSDELGNTAEKLLSVINHTVANINVIWAVPSTSEAGKHDIIIHVDIEDPTRVLEELSRAVTRPGR